jgi:hypothetical protein
VGPRRASIPESAAGGDGASLVVVTDEENFGSGLPGLQGEGGQGAGVGEGGFVDDEELSGAEAPRVLLGAQGLAGELGPAQLVASQHADCGHGFGEAGVVGGAAGGGVADALVEPFGGGLRAHA